jgi:hypothetical protein
LSEECSRFSGNSSVSDAALAKIGRENFRKYVREEPLEYAGMVVTKMWNVWRRGSGPTMRAGGWIAFHYVVLGLAILGLGVLAWRRRWEALVLGTLIGGITLLGGLLQLRGRLAHSRRFLWFAVWLAPVPFILNIAGWMLTENGRQPWIVQGLQLTRDGVSPSVGTATIVRKFCREDRRLGFGFARKFRGEKQLGSDTTDLEQDQRPGSRRKPFFGPGE